MGCCKKQTCNNYAKQDLPTSNISAQAGLDAAKVVVEKLLQLAQFNNKILPSEISPLRLAQLIAELVGQREQNTPTVQPAAVDHFVLKFGPNKAYELHLPAGADISAPQKDAQKMFNFDGT